ncbi:MAG: hypothetical protein GX633_09895 [Clostridiales bacterium]|nr:hypothetical protein [Clostridiales bacterium]
MSGYKVINLEEGMPTSNKAVKRLTFELNMAKRMGITALKLIHGFGSSGSGGKIRLEVRNYLLRLHRREEIQAFIIGERFSIFDKDTRIALNLCDELRRDRDLDRHNNGITIVIL